MIKYKKILFCIAGLLLFSNTLLTAQKNALPLLKISANKRYFITEDGKPFFWLGDTGWLLFIKLTREETIAYLDNRKAKGFNVIQVMVLHDVKHAVNRYGDSALVNNDVSHPRTTAGNAFNDSLQYDFWDHVDFVIDEAAKRGIYMALVPVWGTNVKEGWVKEEQAKKYAAFLAQRYRNKSNVIWLNGGDIKGTEKIDIWNAIGNTLRAQDTHHLITFHPRGRSSSSEWFHQAPWLDFNMFQSGHKDYRQDTVEPRMGEDNWKYVNNDYVLLPVKPVLDGEPSYENIPHGLHDTLAPLWKDKDIRRYAYWSVFAGGCGFTYGHNAIMQFHNGKGSGAYGSKQRWSDAVNDPGAFEMIHLKNLLLSKPYFERVPDQSLIASAQGRQYQYLLATRGERYAFIYTYRGQAFEVNMGKIMGNQVKASWYDPRKGVYTSIGTYRNEGIKSFDPPGKEQDGNDWVLVLESVANK